MTMNDELKTKLTFTREQRRAMLDAWSAAKVALEYAAMGEQLPEEVAKDWLEKITVSRADWHKAERMMEFID